MKTRNIKNNNYRDNIVEFEFGFKRVRFKTRFDNY